VNSGTSATCKLPYANLPIGATGPRATSVYNGSRTVSYLDGTIIDCNTITGKLRGAGGGQPEIDGHVDGCSKDDNTQCSPSDISSLDSGGGTSGGQNATDTRFALIRIPDGSKCADVRNVPFPN
jgi:hypothetical protein